MCVFLSDWPVTIPAHAGIHNYNTFRRENDAQNFYRDIWVGAIVRKRSDFCGAGKASADAHRRIPVRELSVQHSEGREPSRIRTKTERD